MHPYRLIVRTYIQSDGIYTRPDYQNTLTRQSANSNDDPRDPLCDPVAVGRNSGKIFKQGISFEIFSKEYCIGNPGSDTLTLPHF